jgi:hypothetical protein
MNERRIAQLLWLCALAVLGAGLLVTTQTWRRWGERSSRLERKRDILVRLQGKALELERFRTAMERFEALPDKRPEPLTTLLSRTLAGHAPEDVRESRRELEEGWVLRRQEVVFADVPLQAWWAFLQEAEASRPPWRLAACIIRASPQTTGRGHVVTTLEAAERTNGR